MKYYEDLLSKGCFTWEDLCVLVGNRNAASSLIQKYQEKGYIKSVKRNLYVAINLADSAPTANRYVIGSRITESAYLSHHSAFSYYGYTNQVMYHLYISSKTAFRPFEFDGYTYIYLKSRTDDGIDWHPNGVRVTDIERTILDSINDFEKIAGLEELLRCLKMVPVIDEKKLLRYLASYNKQILYQKTGYILEHFKDELNISDSFFESCKEKIRKSDRYLYKGLDKNESSYNKYWQLVVPEHLLSTITKGNIEDAEI